MMRRKLDYYAGEVDFSAAMEALRSGDEQPLQRYLKEASELLNLLADYFGLGDAKRSATAYDIDDEPVGHPEREWEGSFPQVRRGIEQADAEAIGLYLRELGQILAQVAEALDASKTSRDWQLRFARSGRGRRAAPMRMGHDSTILLELWEATRRLGKQEAAIAEVAANRGISRATIMRITRPGRNLTKNDNS